MNETIQKFVSVYLLFDSYKMVNCNKLFFPFFRRMFPYLSIKVSGLDENKQYNVYIDLHQLCSHTLKNHSGRWIPNGEGEPWPPTGAISKLKIGDFLQLSGEVELSFRETGCLRARTSINFVEQFSVE